MCRAIGSDVHALGKPFIANGPFAWPRIPIGIELFDHGGNEIDWFNASGDLVQPADSDLIYRRALSWQRAYGFLMNTDFNRVSHDEMESYMRICAVYGIYPSAFSHNASEDNYFDTPALYERDRDLFKKYIPVIQAMNAQGWQPVTHATCSTNAVALERYGTNSLAGQMFLAIRNLTASDQAATVALDLGTWAGAGLLLSVTNVFDGGRQVLDLERGENTVPLTLPPNECRVCRVDTLLPDSDGDGLPDAWEQVIVDANPTDGVASILDVRWDTDFDGDGMPDGLEYVAGTDPCSPNASFRVSVAGSNVVMVTFPARAASGPAEDGYARHYAVERSTNLLAAAWRSIPGFTNILAGSNFTVQIVEPPTNPASFFRARTWLRPAGAP
jgi:hypothetical protein